MIPSIDHDVKKMLDNVLHSSKDLLGVYSKTHTMAFRLKVRFDTKLAPHELMTKDTRFHNPQWGDDATFPHPIEYIEYYLPIPYKLLMYGMEKYNFFIEAVGRNMGERLKINSFWFCGVIPQTNKVEIWVINSNGIIEHMQKPFGKEYNGTASRGWRKGTPRNNHLSQLLKI